MGIRIALLGIILLVYQDLCAQPEEKDPHSWSFGANAYYGALFRYREGTSALNFTDPYGVELYASIQTKGKRLWQRQFNYPQIGFALAYYNYGAPAELGEAYTFTGYFDNSLFKRKKSSLRFNLGTGLVYSTRYYKPIINEANKAIGSKVSFVLRGTLRYEVQLSQKLYLNFNLAFRHFSNGGLNMPNNGMNFPLIGTGIRFQPHEAHPLPIPTVVEPYDRRIHFNLKLATARKEVLLIDEKHPVYTISLYASKRVSRTNALLLGVDGIWDSSLRHEYINKVLPPPPEEEIDPKMFGITIGHELHMGKMSFLFQLGRYVHEPNHLFPDFYQRYGLKYNLTKFLSINGMLVAHTRTADFVEFGLGIHL